ncbi:c-type cytochrome [Magnetococcus sp. PR-3]|uniref:c-type cytochrome n=1 Tax=Magnetococcus sp. PR-3 TaxID=3120355 RepID=UPI002FCE2623
MLLLLGLGVAAIWKGPVQRGEMLYLTNCAQCHGPRGMGQPGVVWNKPLPGDDLKFPPPPLDHSAHAWHHADGLLQRMIQFGGQDGRMPAWGDKLTPAQIGDILTYLHQLWSPDQLQMQQQQTLADPFSPSGQVYKP